VRVIVSEAKLWEAGHLVEPTSVQSMSPNADPALGPFCLFDPATGLGCAGDWCVEGSVEGAYASGNPRLRTQQIFRRLTCDWYAEAKGNSGPCIPEPSTQTMTPVIELAAGVLYDPKL